MNGRQAKDLRWRAKSICGKSSQDRQYIVLGLRPKADVPSTGNPSLHNVKVGVDKEFKTIWAPVINPIRLHPECGRGQYRRMKKLFRQHRMKVVPPEQAREIDHAASIQ